MVSRQVRVYFKRTRLNSSAYAIEDSSVKNYYQSSSTSHQDIEKLGQKKAKNMECAVYIVFKNFNDVIYRGIRGCKFNHG